MRRCSAPDGLLREGRATVVAVGCIARATRAPRSSASTRCSPKRRRWPATRKSQPRSGRAARRGRRHGAQGRAAGRRGQPQVAVCPRHGAEAEMSAFALRRMLRWALARPRRPSPLASAARRRPTGRLNAKSASLDRRRPIPVTGDARRSARAEFERARGQIARTGRPDLMARAELMRCAARVASLVFEPCAGFEKLRVDAPAAERAYADHLAARATPDSVALLPEAQRGVAKGASDEAAAAAVKGIDDPLSRLVGAGVLFQSGRATPGLMTLAVETASRAGLAPAAARLARGAAHAGREGGRRRRGGAPAPADRHRRADAANGAVEPGLAVRCIWDRTPVPAKLRMGFAQRGDDMKRWLAAALAVVCSGLGRERTCREHFDRHRRHRRRLLPAGRRPGQHAVQVTCPACRPPPKSPAVRSTT